MKVRYSILFLILGFGSYSQSNSTFSLYDFTDSRVNPAKINSNNHMSGSGIFRSQNTTGGSNLTSSYFDFKYPFFKGKKRISTLGLAVGTDRSGLEGIFQTDEARLNYAATVVLSRPNIVSIGTSIKYVNSRINTDQLFTGSQFEPNIGFNPSLPTGEPINSFQSAYVSTSFGAYWTVIDKTGLKKSSLGISATDINQPNASFTNTDDRLPMNLIAEGSYRIRYSRKASYYVTLLHNQSKVERASVLGLSMDLDLYRINSQLRGQRMFLILRYQLQETIAIGAAWKINDLTLGANYDVPVSNNVSNQGAFEIAVKYSKRRRPKRKPNRRRSFTRTPRDSDKDELTDLLNHTEPEETSEEDEEYESEEAPIVDIEKPIILHFKFEFGSTTPIIEEASIINEIGKILIENPDKKILITGHTDHIGSKNINQQLSYDRAQSIFDLLIDMGVDSFQMSIDGKGEEEPISDNKTELGRAQNRRVEIKFLDE